MADATRGGLSPATLTNSLSGKVVNFMFNPFEYTIAKQNTWESKEVIGQNLPMVTFKEGGAQTLSLTLHFDSQMAKSDVRGYTAPLWDMVMIDEKTKNARTGKSEPPPVVFEWGKLHFKAIITRISEKFTVFDEKGTPLRSTVEISLQQYLDEKDVAPQIAGQTSAETPSTTTVVEGDRLDNIAGANGGNPANQREIAAANNIDNMLNVPAGTILRTK